MMDAVRQFRAGRSPFDAIMHQDDDGAQWWSARELMPYLGYLRWENMENVLGKAQAACRNSGHQVSDHFREAAKMIATGKGAQRYVVEVQLTRFGCYLMAMNGDPDKAEVAAAQRYFALMTRAAEIQAVVPVHEGDTQTPRPWSVRFKETYQPHIRAIYQRHPGCFTVVTALVPHFLTLEDELIRHMLKPRSSDRPDVSVGLRWSKHRRQLGHPDVTQFAPLWLPDQGMDVQLRVYPDLERGIFEFWFGQIYLPEQLPDYLTHKQEYRVSGELPPASAADHTCRNLTGRPANLKPQLRRQLNSAGGFCPVGAKLPELPGRQIGLFGPEG